MSRFFMFWGANDKNNNKNISKSKETGTSKQAAGNLMQKGLGKTIEHYDLETRMNRLKDSPYLLRPVFPTTPKQFQSYWTIIRGLEAEERKVVYPVAAVSALTTTYITSKLLNNVFPRSFVLRGASKICILPASFSAGASLGFGIGFGLVLKKVIDVADDILTPMSPRMDALIRKIWRE